MNEKIEIKFLGEMQKIQLLKDDILVIHSSIVLTTEQRAMIGDYFSSRFPQNKFIVIDQGLKLGVLKVDPSVDELGSQS